MCRALTNCMSQMPKTAKSGGDGATYTLRKSIDFGKDPDNMRYDETSKTVSWVLLKTTTESP
jgi:hypothetical protein